MVCWRCKPLGPIESVSAVYVCNEDKVCWVLAAQDRSQSSSSAWERSTGAIESGTIRHNYLTCGFKCRFLLYQNVCFHNVSRLGLLFPKEHRTSTKKPSIRSSLVPFDPVSAMTAPLFVQNNMKKESVLTKRKGVFMANRVGSKKWEKSELRCYFHKSWLFWPSALCQNLIIIVCVHYLQTPDCSYAGFRFKSESESQSSQLVWLIKDQIHLIILSYVRWWLWCVRYLHEANFPLKYGVIISLTPTRIVSVELPSGARKFGVQFRWWQPYHSGRGHDVWALDEISMTSVLFNTISLDFSNVLDVTQSLGFYLGHVQPYCQHDWTLR